MISTSPSTSRLRAPRRRRLPLGLALVGMLVAIGIVQANPTFAEPETVALGDHPARVLDTRHGANNTTEDGQQQGIGRRPAGSVLVLPVAGRGGVPNDAKAVMLNIAAVVPSGAGHVTVFPCGIDRPNTSNINFMGGEVASNAVLAKIGSDGNVCIYTSADTDIIADTNGYMVDGGSRAVNPARVLDSRPGANNTSGNESSESPPVQGVVPLVEGMSLVLNEEFGGSSVDTNRWYRYTSTYGDGNKELQHYRGENVRVADSLLTITAKREQFGGRDFTSGFVSTSARGSAASPAPAGPTFYPRFGRYEMRARLPHAQGLWPAFWLRHRDGASVAEIDIMEYFHSQVPGRTKATLHLNNSSGTLRYNLWGALAFFENPVSSGFHTFGMDILPEGHNVRFRAYLDGVQIGTFLDTDAGNWSSRYPGEPLFDLSINMAIGGNWTGHPDDNPLGRLHLIGRCAIGGTTSGYPNSCATTSPQGHPIQRWENGSPDPTFQIDWVRIYELDGS